jgi:protein phosphatase
MRPQVAAKSDVGRVRDGNEDSYLLQEPYFAVADGMGGHAAGDVASRIAVQTLSERIGAGAANPEGLERAVKEANAAIFEKATADPSLHGMGTTCTLALVDGTAIHLAHVGDSRAYLQRGDELTLLTEDHTLVGRMVKEGRLKPEEAERHPQRSIITRVLGVDGDVEVDLLTVPVEEGDRVLLCSDGLTSMIDADTIRDILSRNDDLDSAVEELIAAANEAGGEDNITAVLLGFGGDDHGGPRIVDTGERETETPRRREDTQPGAHSEGATGAFTVPPKRDAPAARDRRSHPILVTVALVLLLLVAGVAAFKYLIVDNSYYVAASDDGTIGIYRGLPDEVLGMEFQEVVETSQVRVEDLPDFLMEDVQNVIETDSLEEARSTLANLEERAQDEEFQRSRDRNDDSKGNGSG